MVAFERYITVENPETLVVSGLSLRVGQRVRVTITPDEAGESRDTSDLRELLKRTRAQGRPVTDEEIAAEVEAVRRARR